MGINYDKYLKNELEKEHLEKMKRIEIKNLKRQYKEIEDESKYKGTKKRLEESKFYIRLMFVLVIEIVIFSQIIMWRTGDLSALYALIGISATLATALLGYYSKSKNENVLKIQNGFEEPQDEEDGSVG